MFKSKHLMDAVDWGNRADIEMIAIDEALSAYNPNPRSPAFAVKKIFKIATSYEGEDQIFMTREDFLVMFPGFKGSFYAGQMSWDSKRSCWSLEDGLTIDAARIQEDALRWYVNQWDFSRHTRDTEFSYPEDSEFAPSGDGVDHLFNALMPLEGELTRRIFIDQQKNEIGYCDVYKSKNSDMYVAETGFFNDRRTHGLHRVVQPFWELEGFTVPGLLRHHKVLSYRVHSIYALRGAMS
jgi:hypothetical protein